MWYNLDIYKFAQHLIPPSLRLSRLTAFINILLYPFYLVLQAFKIFRNNSLKKLNINGQVIYIEKALNDAFELKNGEIYLSDTDEVIGGVLYKDASQTMAVYASGEANVTYVMADNEGKHDGDYIVNVPSFLKTELESIKTIVEYNKPAGRSYVIKIYEYE